MALDDAFQIRYELEDIPADAETSGSFLTSGSFDNGVNPGLEVPGVGLIRLPLSADDAKAIIQSCHRSPYGKESETLVDDSVQKSWELNADQIALRNPAWQKQIQTLLAGRLRPWPGCPATGDPGRTLQAAALRGRGLLPPTPGFRESRRNVWHPGGVPAVQARRR